MELKEYLCKDKDEAADREETRDTSGDQIIVCACVCECVSECACVCPCAQGLAGKSFFHLSFTKTLPVLF